MMTKIAMALDKSLRSYDADGRLHLAKSNISKATVNPYYGKEIPNYESLGLQPDAVYQLLRDPEELEKAAPTFVNLPILIEHVPVSADKPRPELVIGSTGSDCEFDGEYLNNSLSFWDGRAIALIESEEQKELSSAYRYTPDMTAGVFEGIPYDGVMRDIIGNHVALVDVGRAGSDVVVADKDPFLTGDVHMKNKTKMSAQLRLALDKANAKKPIFAKDADLDQIVDILSAAVSGGEGAGDDDIPAEPTAVDNDALVQFLTGKLSPEDLAAAQKMLSATDEDPEDPPAPPKGEDEDPEDPPKAQDGDEPVTKAAMDKAIAKASAAAAEKAKKDVTALYQAREDVKDLVGFVAMDSASAVYKFALDKAGVNTKGVDPSAFGAMVGLLKQAKAKPAFTAQVAMDSSATKAQTDLMPNLSKRINGGA
jgi:hypothetical protein